jgi:hypothetical protein
MNLQLIIHIFKNINQLQKNEVCLCECSSEVLGASVLVKSGLENREYGRRKHKQTNSMVWVRERTIPTERPPLVGEVIANFCG